MMFASRSIQSEEDNLIIKKGAKKEDPKVRATRLALNQKVYETFIQIKMIKFNTPCVKSSFCKFNIDNNFQQVSKLCDKKSFGRHKHYWANIKYRILIPSFKFSSQSSLVIDLCTYHGQEHHRVVGRVQFPIKEHFEVKKPTPHSSPRNKGKQDGTMDGTTEKTENKETNNNENTNNTNHPNAKKLPMQLTNVEDKDKETNEETQGKEKMFEIYNSQGRSLGAITLILSCKPIAVALEKIESKDDPQYKMLLRSLEKFHYY